MNIGKESNMVFHPGTGKAYDTAALESFINDSEELFELRVPEVRMERLLNEYESNIHTDRLLTEFWDTTWAIWGKTLGKNFEIPTCDRTTEEIIELEEKGRMLIYLPPELASSDSIHELEKLIPDGSRLRPWTPPLNEDDKSSIINHYEQSGWLSVEKDLRLSDEQAYSERRRKPTPEVLRKKRQLKEGKLEGQTVNTYILGSIFSKLITGEYFDNRGYGTAGEKHYPSLLFGSAIHIPYEDTEENNMPYAQQGLIFSWGGALDYSIARTVEPKQPVSQDRVITPEQLFSSYRLIYPATA